MSVSSAPNREREWLQCAQNEPPKLWRLQEVQSHSKGGSSSLEVGIIAEMELPWSGSMAERA